MSTNAFLLLALGVSMDNFAVSLGLGAGSKGRALKPMLRLALVFGSFQFFMPLLGWLVGSRVAFVFHGYENWLIFAALAFTGWRMLRSARESAEGQLTNPSSASTLLSLAFATSIDSLAIGVALAVMRVNVLEASAIMGLVAACLSFGGLLVGGQLGQALGKRSQLVGGLVLVTIGLRALLLH